MRDDTHKPEDVRKALSLLTQERELYAVMRKMVGRQLEAIVLEHDMDALMHILQEKQDVISQLQLLADAWADILPAPTPEGARSADRLREKLMSAFSGSDAVLQALAETQAAADDLMEAEKNVQAELEKHVRSLRDSILQMKQGQNAFIGYARTGSGGADPDL